MFTHKYFNAAQFRQRYWPQSSSPLSIVPTGGIYSFLEPFRGNVFGVNGMAFAKGAANPGQGGSGGSGNFTNAANSEYVIVLFTGVL